MKKHMKKSVLILSASLMAVSLTSCAVWFQEKIPMVSKSGQSSLFTLLSKEAVITVCSTPTQLFASQGLYPNQICISWSKSEEASSYRLERAIVKGPNSKGEWELPEESDFESVQDFVYGTVATDEILRTPKATNEEYNWRFYYRVSAENLGKGYDSSEFTDIKNPDTAGCGWLLAAPQKTDAWKGRSTDEIQITWEPVAEAVKYEIWRSENDDGTNSALINTTFGNKTKYSDYIPKSKQGTEYYYFIKAITNISISSANSSLAMGFTLKDGAPAAPSNVRVENGFGTDTNTLTIKWDEVGGTGTITYALYRTSSIDSVFTLLSNKIDGSTTLYTDKQNNPSAAVYYYYLQTIKTNDEEVSKSSFSETGPDSPNPAMGFYLTAPQSFEINDGSSDSTVTAKWTPIAGYDVTDTNFVYNIYYSDSKDGSYELLTENISSPINSEGYIEYEIEKKNFYKIRTKNPLVNKESPDSSAAAPVPAAPKNVRASKTKNLTASYSANESGVYPVEITWEKPELDNPSGYYVYRSTKPDSSFRKLTESPVTELSYIDENETAKAGTFYYYKVISLNSLNQGKKGNDPANDSEHLARGYGALTREQWFREYNKSIFTSQNKTIAAGYRYNGLSLMHKSPDTSKLGSETIYGECGGTCYYNAALDGLGAYITIKYTNYCDAYINGKEELGPYFILNGNTDTTSNMSGNGNMLKSTESTGMYPGTAVYDNLTIKGGAAGGGYYIVTTKDLSGNVILNADKVDWLVGEGK